MAILTAGTAAAARMDLLRASDLNDGDVTTATSTRFAVNTGDGYLDTFSGSGFTYGSGGSVTGGTVTQYDYTLNGGEIIQVTGANVSASALYAAVSAENTGQIFDLFFGGDDRFTGGALADYLDARDGNNDIYGGAGADTLVAGGGNNHIFGNAASAAQGSSDGADRIVVGDGTNYVNGNAGDDYITVGNGANRVFGGGGNDSIEAGNGNNRINGNQGNDQIVVGNGYNVIHGGAGDDQFYTNQATVAAGNQQFGDLGNDQFHTGIGYDLMTGGAGADVFWLGGANNGTQAATIGGTTYYDEVTDFTAGEDHFVVRAYVPDRIVTGTQTYASVGDAQAAAQAQLAATGDGHAVAAYQVGSDTMLFFNATGGSTDINSFLKLDGVQAGTIATSQFADATTF